MFHVVADAVAARVEGGFFFVGEGKLHDLLHAVGADDAGNADKQTIFAVFAAKLGAGRA